MLFGWLGGGLLLGGGDWYGLAWCEFLELVLGGVFLLRVEFIVGGWDYWC